MKKTKSFHPTSLHWVFVATVGISIGISLAHFWVPHYYIAIHGFLRKTYYIPVILAGLLYGLRKTIYLVGFIAMIYLPFVLSQWGNHPFAANLEEIYDILMLASVGGITGVLSERERKRREELQEAYHDTVIRLAVAAEYHDDNTGAHLQRISRYAEMISRNLRLPPYQVDLIRLGSPMHDIGKIGIPDHILLSKKKLTEREFKTMKTHPEIGYKILKDSQSSLLKMSSVIAFAHHERFDGSGYPMGLSATDIPLPARIVAVADVFDALTTSRPYKKSYSIDESIKIMGKEVGSHFDPKVFEAFIRGIDEIVRPI
jgi:response regulator RpfG family c-di-GMP phosphodiesterase